MALWVVATTLAPLQQALRIGRSALSCAGVLGGVSGFCSSGVQGPRSPGPNSTRFDPVEIWQFLVCAAFMAVRSQDSVGGPPVGAPLVRPTGRNIQEPTSSYFQLFVDGVMYKRKGGPSIISLRFFLNRKPEPLSKERPRRDLAFYEVQHYQKYKYVLQTYLFLQTYSQKLNYRIIKIIFDKKASGGQCQDRSVKK